MPHYIVTLSLLIASTPALAQDRTVEPTTVDETHCDTPDTAATRGSSVRETDQSHRGCPPPHARNDRTQDTETRRRGGLGLLMSDPLQNFAWGARTSFPTAIPGAPSLSGIDASGDVMWVWADRSNSRSSEDEILYARYNASPAGWSTSAILDVDVWPRSLAVGSDGSAFLMFTRQQEAYVSKFTPTNQSWAAPHWLDDGFYGLGKVVVTGNSSASFHWLRSADNVSIGLGSQSYVAASDTFGPTVVLDTQPGIADYHVKSNGSEEVLISWSAYAEGEVVGQRLDVSTGQWSPKELLGTRQAVEYSNVVIDTDEQGNHIVIWSLKPWPTGTERVLGATYYDAASGVWEAMPDVSSGLPERSSNPSGYDVRLLPNGRALAIWTEYDGAERQAFAAELNLASGQWSTTQALPFSPAETGKLAMDDTDTGRIYVAWAANSAGFDKGDVSVATFRVQGGQGKWSEPITIDQDSLAINHLSISVSANTAGQAIVTWSSFADLDDEDSGGFVNAVIYQ